MKKFRLEDYPGDYAMHCDTEEKANLFLKYLDSVGKSWHDNGSYLDENNWSRYHRNTCYLYNFGRYSPTYYYGANGYKILEFDDFIWEEKTMEKKIIKGEYLKNKKLELLEDGTLRIIEEPKGKFIPEHDEPYWFVNSFGIICYDMYNNREFDKYRLDNYKIFKTNKECELYLHYLDDKNRLKKEYVYGEDNYFMRCIGDEIDCSLYRNIKCTTTYFKSEDDIKLLINKYGEDKIKEWEFDIYE